jgi:SAM-dependent methyltransferase
MGFNMTEVNQELLPGARRMFDLALEHCGACQDYHGLRGYFLATKTVFGALSGAVQLRSVLAGLAPGRPRVLIAGSADSGLLRLVSESYEDQPLQATIVDLCNTPLKLCEEFAAERKIEATCVCGDLATFASPHPLDLIFAHLVLGFMTSQQRALTLQSWVRSLASGGKLVLASHLNSNGKGVQRIEKLLDATQNGFPFDIPEPAAQFRARMRRYIDQKNQLKKVRTSLAELIEELEQAGFSVENLTPQPEPTGLPVSILVCSKR